MLAPRSPKEVLQTARVPRGTWGRGWGWERAALCAPRQCEMPGSEGTEAIRQRLGLLGCSLLPVSGFRSLCVALLPAAPLPHLWGSPGCGRGMCGISGV